MSNLHIHTAPPAHPQGPLGGSVAPSLAGRRRFPRPGERREDAGVLGILDAPGTRRPPPPAQPRGSRAAQPARCGLAAGSHPSPQKALRGKRLVLPFFFFLTSKIGADVGYGLYARIYSSVLRDEGEIREARGLFLTKNLSTATLPRVLRASTPHLLSQSIAREPQPQKDLPCLGRLCPRVLAPEPGSHAQLLRLGLGTQPSFGVRFGGRFPLRMPQSPGSEL